MTDTVIATADTNPTPDSVIKVLIEDLVCMLSIEKNLYSDTLPIIPKEARVRGEKNVLYRLKLRAELTQHSNSKIVAGHALKIISNRRNDRLSFSGKTDSNGVMFATLETYEAGNVELNVATPGVSSVALQVVLKNAWYESLFLITGYNVCNEIDFSGPLVSANGLNEKHKDDFLFGARGVPMQGTGADVSGRYIKLLRLGGVWLRNSRGALDRVSSPEETRFGYSDGVIGRFGPVTENHSIAVDPNIIPPKAKVSIEGVGARRADDTGSRISNYHIDNFLGAGKSVVDAWLRGGVNGTHRRVQFLGD